MSGDRRELNFTNVEIYQVFQSASNVNMKKKKKKKDLPTFYLDAGKYKLIGLSF